MAHYGSHYRYTPEESAASGSSISWWRPETVTPDYVHSDTGQPVSFFERLGVGGQGIARRWLAENPAYVLRRVQCSIANDPARLRDQVESPRA